MKRVPATEQPLTPGSSMGRDCWTLVTTKIFNIKSVKKKTNFALWNTSLAHYSLCLYFTAHWKYQYIKFPASLLLKHEWLAIVVSCKIKPTELVNQFSKGIDAKKIDYIVMWFTCDRPSNQSLGRVSFTCDFVLKHVETTDIQTNRLIRKFSPRFKYARLKKLPFRCSSFSRTK